MKTKYLLLLAISLLFSFTIKSDKSEFPWTEKELLSPDILANKINKNQLKNTVILSVGFDAIIKNSVDIGAGRDHENIDKLKNHLKNINKTKEIVLYCGCCPLTKCPNMKPAFTATKELGFKNVNVLNLTNNIKTNWLDKGYPSDEN